MAEPTMPMNKTGKLYGVFPLAEKQKKPVDDHCFGDCGHISLGMMQSEWGPMMVCCYNDCPHLDEQTTEPVGTSEMTGESVYLRILKFEE